VAVCPADRHPRVIYGCRLNSWNSEDGEDEEGDIPAAIETQARLTGTTYRLQPRDTVQLTSNATVSAWATAAVSAAHHTPTVIAILERLRGADTPPRDVDVHLNSHGIPMPVHRPPVQAPRHPPLDADDDDENEVDQESGSKVDREGGSEGSEEEEVNIGSIAGLNGSGVHDQSAVPPPTRTNIKRSNAKQAENTNQQTVNKQTSRKQKANKHH
jgi:hypothetical protein